MKIRLLNKYTFHSRELAEGTEIEVTNGLGNRMIKSGDAESVGVILPKKKDKPQKKEKKSVILPEPNQEKTPDTKE
jgi:hypothetical protein